MSSCVCFFASFCLSDYVSDIWFFTYCFYWCQEIFSCRFLLPCFSSFVTIIFTMLVSCPIKTHLLISVSHQQKIKSTLSNNSVAFWTFFRLKLLKQNDNKKAAIYCFRSHYLWLFLGLILYSLETKKIKNVQWILFLISFIKYFFCW